MRITIEITDEQRARLLELAASRICRDLARHGEPIGSANCLIAGICLANGAPLRTRNRKHFERIPGLSLGTLTL